MQAAGASFTHRVGLHHVVHPAHAAVVVTVAVAAALFLLLGLFNHDAVGRQQEDGDFGGVLQGGALDLGRGDDAGLDDVDVFAGQGAVAGVVLALHHAADDHAAAVAGVGGDRAERDGEG